MPLHAHERGLDRNLGELGGWISPKQSHEQGRGVCKNLAAHTKLLVIVEPRSEGALRRPLRRSISRILGRLDLTAFCVQVD